MKRARPHEGSLGATSARMPWRGASPPHLPCGRGDIAPDVLLPGDPDRVVLLTRMLSDAHTFGRRREFAAVTGTFEGHRLTICSSGIGGPSTEIALVELAMLGARRVVRIGGMGALDPELDPGSFVAVTDAIGGTGTAALYGTKAAAWPPIVAALEGAAGRLGLLIARGTVASSDSYYLGQDRPIGVPSISADRLPGFAARGALGVDMECETVLAVSARLSLRAGALLAVHGNRATDAWMDDYETAQENLLRVAGAALSLLAAEDVSPTVPFPEDPPTEG